MSKRDAHRDLFRDLQEAGMLDYGSYIPAEFVRASLGLEVPEVASKKVFDALAVTELAAIDYVRNILLGQGKYIGAAGGGYRVFLPSENAAQIELYMSAADKKLSRALKLSRSTPVHHTKNPDQTEARILLKRTGLRSAATTTQEQTT